MPKRPKSKSARSSSSSPVVLITGASQGIGEAIALAFAREMPRARLALVARSGKKLQGVVRRCQKAAGNAVAFEADVADERAVELLRKAVLEQLGEVDVLINNAGKFALGSFLETSVETFDAMIAANLRSQFLVARALVPAMVKRGSGDVFNMGSIAGLQAYTSSAAYCAAKFGVTGLSKVMRAELRSTGVRVCTVYPGATVSPSWTGSGVPEERMMPASDVAQAFIDCYRMTRRSVVEEIVLRPQLGDV